jgi:DNA processing protein
MDAAELGAWLRLTLTPGVGNETARRLLAAWGLPQNIFAQSHAALAPLTGPALARALLTEPEGLSEQIDTTRRWLDTPGAAGVGRALVTLGDPAYPAALLTLEDPPLMLYLLGRTASTAATPPLAAAAARGIAMVGSRNPTPQGAANARQFARALAGTGLTVVSGLALGVDGAAHEGALEGAAAGDTSAPATVAVVWTVSTRASTVTWRTALPSGACWSANIRWARRRCARISRAATA